jgi:hypothetical protein
LTRSASCSNAGVDWVDLGPGAKCAKNVDLASFATALRSSHDLNHVVVWRVAVRQFPSKSVPLKIGLISESLCNAERPLVMTGKVTHASPPRALSLQLASPRFFSISLKTSVGDALDGQALLTARVGDLAVHSHAPEFVDVGSTNRPPTVLEAG